jgi:hypothetical protein
MTSPMFGALLETAILVILTAWANIGIKMMIKNANVDLNRFK